LLQWHGQLAGVG